MGSKFPVCSSYVRFIIDIFCTLSPADTFQLYGMHVSYTKKKNALTTTVCSKVLLSSWAIYFIIFLHQILTKNVILFFALNFNQKWKKSMDSMLSCIKQILTLLPIGRNNFTNKHTHCVIWEAMKVFKVKIIVSQIGQ